MKENQNHRSDNEKPEEIIDEIVNILDGLHTELAQDAIDVGQAKDKYLTMRSKWESLGNASTGDPDIAQIYYSGTMALSSIRDDYKSIADNYSPVHGLMGTILPSTDTGLSLTNSTANLMVSVTHPKIRVDVDIEPVPTSQREKTRAGLRKLSLELVETYDAIWETLYGTRSDPERGSMYLIRQVFDHLFAILAPDDKVMASKFWHPKDDHEPNQVTRAERIEYAAFTHVKNETASKRLIASTNHMLDVYKTLNKAHKRGKLDRSQSRGSLKEMQAIIADWIQSLSL